MALPPPGDSQRPLHLAARLTLVLGVLFVGLGVLGMLPLVVRMRAGGVGRFPTGTVLLFLLPGSIYLVCSVFLRRRSRRAVVAALVIDAIHIGVALFGVTMTAIFAPFGENPILLVPLGIFVIFTFVLTALGYYLLKSFRAIRERPPDVDRGFEPLPVAAVVQPVRAGRST